MTAVWVGGSVGWVWDGSRWHCPGLPLSPAPAPALTPCQPITSTLRMPLLCPRRYTHTQVVTFSRCVHSVPGPGRGAAAGLLPALTCHCLPCSSGAAPLVPRRRWSRSRPTWARARSWSRPARRRRRRASRRFTLTTCGRSLSGTLSSLCSGAGRAERRLGGAGGLGGGDAPESFQLGGAQETKFHSKKLNTSGANTRHEFDAGMGGPNRAKWRGLPLAQPSLPLPQRQLDFRGGAGLAGATWR